MPTESDSPTENTSSIGTGPDRSDRVDLYPVYLSVTDEKQTQSTSGDYYRIPLPPDLAQLGWPVTDNDDFGLICGLCEGTRNVIRWFASTKGAAKHLGETHDLSGDGITTENTRRATQQEAEREGDVDVDDAHAVDPAISHLYLTKERVTVEAADRLCLRLGTADAIDTSDDIQQWYKRKIRSATAPRQNVERIVSIPAAYTNPEYDPSTGLPNPFFSERSEDQVYMEVDWKTEEVRIWSISAGQARYRELEAEGRKPVFRAPIGVVLIAETGRTARRNGKPPNEGFVDLAAHTEYDGQRFEIVPIDGMHPLFYGEAIRQGKSERDRGTYTVHLDREVFNTVASRENGDLPRLDSDLHRLQIIWETDDGSEIYDAVNSRQFRVILPAKVSFGIKAYIEEPKKDYQNWLLTNFAFTRLHHRTGYTAANKRQQRKYTPLDRDWMGEYVNPDTERGDDYYRVYLPVPTKGYPSGYRVAW